MSNDNKIKIDKSQLSDYAKKKLDFINGSNIVRNFPFCKPNLEWTGAVIDLLIELDLLEKNFN